LDILMAAWGSGTTPRLIERPDLTSHARAKFAVEIRDDTRVLGYRDKTQSSLAIIGRGIGGLTELSFEIDQWRRGASGGIELILDALTAVPTGQLVVAGAAPGNAASVRALLSAGFVPLGSFQLFRRAT
jgi:RimJ/RimL family protein N-acetyltransferase